MEPEHKRFQKESPFPGVDFQVPCETSGVYVGANMKVDVDMHLMLCQKFGRDLLKHRNLPIDFNRLSQV